MYKFWSPGAKIRDTQSRDMAAGANAAANANGGSHLLFITSTRIGDAVLSTGVLNHLISENPALRVTAAGGVRALPLFAAVPNLEALYPMIKRPFGGHWAILWGRAVRTHWDTVVDLRGSVLPRLLRARRRYRKSGRNPQVHRVVENARVLGLEKPPPPRIHLAREHRVAARRRLQKTDRILALGPAANWRGKTWRAERFAVLLKRLIAPGAILQNAHVAVFGAAGERPSIQPVLDAIPENRRIDLVGRVGLLSACACLETCDFFIGNDSGLMHMAAAMGTPTLGLFGPSSMKNYAPWGDHAKAVSTPKKGADLFPPDFNHRTTETLMDTLTVDAVEEAAVALWRKVHPPPGQTAAHGHAPHETGY